LQLLQVGVALRRLAFAGEALERGLGHPRSGQLDLGHFNRPGLAQDTDRCPAHSVNVVRLFGSPQAESIGFAPQRVDLGNLLAHEHSAAIETQPS
jgi:hypothetical protein